MWRDVTDDFLESSDLANVRFAFGIIQIDTFPQLRKKYCRLSGRHLTNIGEWWQYSELSWQSYDLGKDLTPESLLECSFEDQMVGFIFSSCVSWDGRFWGPIFIDFRLESDVFMNSFYKMSMSDFRALENRQGLDHWFWLELLSFKWVLI